MYKNAEKNKNRCMKMLLRCMKISNCLSKLVKTVEIIYQEI